MSLLNIRNLSVSFGHGKTPLRAVSSVDLSVERGEIIGIVGESGSGKSVTMLAMMGLIDAPGVVSADTLSFDGQDLLAMKPAQKRQIVGKDIAMIFQDALSSLNPAYTVGYQLMETLKQHTDLRGAALKARTIELLEQVEIPDAASRLNAYPHQLSGGMSQRVMIAMAISCNPKLLIADEPTTALDVTVQAQIMQLLVQLQKQNHMALILITHDLAVVAQIAQRMVVMYAGEVVETSATAALFATPRHPYTQALLRSIPEHNQGARRLATLAGVVPGQYDRPLGCLLSPRCAYATEHCRDNKPALVELAGTQVRCFTPLDVHGEPSHE